jgi:hypothetical protein
MLWTNLRNQVRQTPLPKWKPLIPLFEAVMNSFQAVRDAKRHGSNGFIRITIERENILIDEDQAPIRNFIIVDNGIGLNDANFDSFNTAFSDHKLSRGGKGLGRFTWLKAFDRVEIDSVFREDGDEALRRSFTFDEGYELEKEGLRNHHPVKPRVLRWAFLALRSHTRAPVREPPIRSSRSWSSISYSSSSKQIVRA